MRIRTLNADGSRRDATVTIPITDQEGQRYTDPEVSITARYLSQSELRECERNSMATRKNDRTRGMERYVDQSEYVNRILVASVEGWDGVLSDDGAPVPVCEVAVRELPFHVKLQISEVIATTEAADETAASFRQSADVVRVVGG